jgi:glutamyl-Q tRNA(Asp) synthetase
MITRFAPSPTGPLHLGHAYSAILAHDMAMAAGGTFLLRIEDIDRSRARPEWEDLIYEDLRWLGLSWEEPVMRQSGRMAAYSDALDRFWAMGLLYPCDCTRRDIAEALSAPQEGAEPMIGPDGPVYPGTCRPCPERPRPIPAPANGPCAWTWHARRRETAVFTDGTPLRASRKPAPGPRANRAEMEFIARGSAARASATSFWPAATWAPPTTCQSSSTTPRRASPMSPGAQDLFEATKIHVILQRLLDLPTPIYHHHRLIRDETGQTAGQARRRPRHPHLPRRRRQPGDIRRLVGL